MSLCASAPSLSLAHQLSGYRIAFKNVDAGGQEPPFIGDPTPRVEQTTRGQRDRDASNACLQAVLRHASRGFTALEHPRDAPVPD